jgi:mannosyltransferase OCH1-like enzyme
MSIPKITHQIWMQGFENIPDKFKKNVSDLHKLNPEYEHKQWNENSLRVECSKYSKECVERFDSFSKMIMKIDLARYVVLYNYGGISVDTDMVQLSPIRNTPSIKSETFIISQSGFPYNLTGNYNNAVIITVPGNTIVKKIIDEIIANNKSCSKYIIKELCVHDITGPIHVTKVVKNSKEPHTVLDNKYYEPCTSIDIFCNTHKDSIMDHKHEGSWSAWYLSYILKIVTFILRFFIYIVLAIVLIFIFFYKKNNKSAKKSKRV